MLTTVCSKAWFSWGAGAAIVPAILVTILLFMDQHITAIIVNRKDNKLKVKWDGRGNVGGRGKKTCWSA